MKLSQRYKEEALEELERARRFRTYPLSDAWRSNTIAHAIRYARFLNHLSLRYARRETSR